MTAQGSLSHADLLRLYCRCCGQRSIARTRTQILYPVSDCAEAIQMLHDVNVEEESKEIYPKLACEGCYAKFSAKAKNGIKEKIQTAYSEKSSNPDALIQLGRAHPMPDFWSHSSQGCQVCDDDMYGNQEQALLYHTMLSSFTHLKASKQGGLVVSSDPKDAFVLASEVPDIDAFKEMSDPYRVSVMAHMLRRYQEERPEFLSETLKSYGVALEDSEERKAAANVFVDNDCDRVLYEMKDFSAAKEPLSLLKILWVDITTKNLAGAYADGGVCVDMENEKLNSVFGTRKAKVEQKNEKVVPAKEVQVKTTRDKSVVVTEKKRRGQALKIPKGTTLQRIAPSASIDLTRDTATAAAAKRRPNILPSSKQPRGGVSGAAPKTAAAKEQVRVTAGDLENLKRQFHSMLPSNRFLRADIVRFLMLQATQVKRKMLTRVGIHFDLAKGDYVCEKTFTIQDGKPFDNRINHLVDVQWAVIMAEVIFKLIHPKDTLSLEHIGITIDETNPKVPLFYRIEHEVRRYSRLNSSSKPTGEHLVTKFDLSLSSPHVRAVEAALQCTNDEAQAFIANAKKNIMAANNNNNDISIVRSTKLVPRAATAATEGRLQAINAKQLAGANKRGRGKRDDWGAPAPKRQMYQVL